jgi:diguanylate cyclase (GGDEF)-like protein
MTNEYDQRDPHKTDDWSTNSDGPRDRRAPKKITFDDFQITRAAQEAQVEEERRVWKERQERIDQHKPGILRLAVPRLKSLRDEMIGVQNKLPFFKRPRPEQDGESKVVNRPASIAEPPRDSNEPYFADHERSVIRVMRRDTLEEPPIQIPPNDDVVLSDRTLIESYYESPDAEPLEAVSDDLTSFEEEESPIDEEILEIEPNEVEEIEEVLEDITEEEDIDSFEDEWASSESVAPVSASFEKESTPFEMDPSPFESERASFEMEPVAIRKIVGEELEFASPEPVFAQTVETVPSDNGVLLEPRIEPSLKAFLDSLRAFDSYPRRAHEHRDPRADFVVLLGELLDILREQVEATSAMFFWVNSRKQHLVLESAALDDRAYQFLVSDKRFPIELDAVSRVVAKRKPELHSSIPAQAELDLIPYYRDAIGIRSFAGMPVLFGDGLVAVLTVDSVIEENYTQETLRILTSYSRLISGLIRSYIEKYDLLASARTLESARKLHQIVSPDTSLRVLREQRKNPDYILRALTEAASEIIDWDWLAAASFDETRRIWSIATLQSKHGGAYVPPQTPISLSDSLVGKCLQSGRSIRQDVLTPQSIRYNIEEDRNAAAGHSFMVIPIRTTNKNYGALAIEHTERARFTDADVETLEHLARSAAAALEIIALSEIVGERALTDLLTGALNKRGLLMRINEELSRAMEFDEPLTFVLFEIDGASEFASRFAQEDSDTIVLAITRLLRFGVRPFDVIARAGEYSFSAILVRMTDEEGYLWSEKMRKMIVSEVIAIGKRSFSVTVSIGVSGARRDGTVEELIEGAELAIERARELGGNNVIVY